MKTITNSLITISALSLLLIGCGEIKKDAKAAQKPTTIEEIQKVNGKPARVVKASTIKLTDVRSFSGTIEGSQQTNAVAKLGDPISKIHVRVGSFFPQNKERPSFGLQDSFPIETYTNPRNCSHNRASRLVSPSDYQYAVP